MKKHLKSKKILLFLVILLTILAIEPTFRNKLTFAVTYFDRPSVAFDRIEASFLNEKTQMPITQERGRLPEPTTFILFASGIAGIIVRFVRKSFDKFKRYLDLCLSALGMTIALPILTLAAILIKLNSKGPVFYKQNRLGKSGKIFEIYKLRSMRIDAEKGIGAVWAKENDPRITSIGRLLRKTHIDEIPQLFNVIKGEMSIVGPRPERPEMVRDLKTVICDYEKRLMVKPGITGLAQVVHKYDETIEDVKKKVKYDLLYIKRRCLLTDLGIMAQTFTVVLTGKGAH